MAVDLRGRFLSNGGNECRGLVGERIAAGMTLIELLDLALRLAHIAQLAALQVRRHIESRLKDAQFSYGRLADPARRQIRDAAILELDARIRNVDGVCQH